MENIRAVTVVLALSSLAGLSARKLCLRGDFHHQFRYIVKNEMLSDEEVVNASRVISDLTDSLEKKWPGTVITPFGSIVSGLALKASDVDCLANVPGYNDTLDHSIVMDALELLRRQPDLYEDFTPKLLGRVPILTLIHVPTRKYVDLSFKGPTGVANSHLLNYYMFLNHRIREITLFLKFWCETHGVIGQGMLPSYALALMSVFFFQQKEMLPTIVQLQNNSEPVYVEVYNHGFNAIPFQVTNEDSVYQLLGDFFRYYREFDFDDAFISAFVGRPVSKSGFTNVATVPEEFALYKRRLRDGSVEPLSFKMKLVIQDAFEHSKNVAQRRNRSVSEKLMSHIQRAAHMFDVLPPHRVLRAILKKEKDFVQEKKLLVLDEFSGGRDCASAA